MRNRYLVEFDELCIDDTTMLGSETTAIGEMFCSHNALGINTPRGFVITSEAYRHFIEYNKIDTFFREIQPAAFKTENRSRFRRLAGDGLKLVDRFRFPEDLEQMIIAAYRKLSLSYQQNDAEVTIHSYLLNEQQNNAGRIPAVGLQSVNLSSSEAVLMAVQGCFCFFSEDIISALSAVTFAACMNGMAVCIRKRVRSDFGAYGTAYNSDPGSTQKDIIVIQGAFGLGNIVKEGSVAQDQFVVAKSELYKGAVSIIHKELGIKDRIILSDDHAIGKHNIIRTKHAFQHRFCLSDAMVVQLSKWMMLLEASYLQSTKKWTPIKVQWALDGFTNEIFILHSSIHLSHLPGGITIDSV